MTSTALIIGGTGQIGRATAHALLAEGYDVTIGSRSGGSLEGVDVRTMVFDRDDSAALAAATAGVDLVVDAVAFTAQHASDLLTCAIGSLVVISTGSVYLGDNGRAFDDAAATGEYPAFPTPVTELQPTIDRPGIAYGAAKAAMERVLLQQDALPVSVLRPGSVHGPLSQKIREWHFIKRALDGRPTVVLARGGRQRFSTSATANIAALVTACAARPGTRALNAVDDESLTMAEIAQTVYDLLDRPLEIAAFDGPPADGGVGATPWDSPIDFVCSMDAAREQVGYRAALSYRDAVAVDAAWIATQPTDGLFPAAAGWFPYEAEDRWLEAHS